MNNLYGWAMSEYLPYGELQLLRNVDGFHVNLMSEKSEIGSFLEVDLEYPKELHELYNYYLLAPQKRLFLVICCQNIADKYEIKIGDTKILIPDLGNKTKYLLHYRNIQLYLSLGMKFTKIRKVLKFKQSG